MASSIVLNVRGGARICVPAAPETERRRQLMRLRAGLQSGIEAHPLLATASPWNLNPEFWCGS